MEMMIEASVETSHTEDAASIPPARLTAAERLFGINLIYAMPQALETLRGQEALARFPNAEVRLVDSHQNIPGLFGNEGNVKQWVGIKRSVLVVGIRKTFDIRENGRSADFIAPGQANGCAMACVYCYVPRHKGFANLVTLFVNIERVEQAIRKHAQKLGPKQQPNQTDPVYWTYDLGENSDCSADALLSDNIRDLVAFFRSDPLAKGTFATKFVNRELLDYDPQGKTRIRFSLMPAAVSKVVDVRTSPIAQRIAAVNDFVAAGWEVHLNFSPVIVTEDWQEKYVELFQQIDDVLGDAAKRQLAAEVIFLTHNAELHEVNVAWHPKGEALLWRPELQEEKRSLMGGRNLRYKSGYKGGLVREFNALAAKHLPYCRIRYSF